MIYDTIQYDTKTTQRERERKKEKDNPGSSVHCPLGEPWNADPVAIVAGPQP
jgi:hypothetical protein